MTEEEASHREEVARTTRESAIYLVAKSVPFLCNLLFIKFYTAYFTPDVIGEYETLLALAMVVSSLAVGWLQISLLRFFPKCMKENRVSELTRTLAVGFVGSVAVTLLLGSTLWFFRDTGWGESLYLNLLPWVGALFLANSLFILTTTLLRAKRFPVRFSIASASFSFFNLAGAYFLALFLGSFLVSLVAGTAVGLLLPSFAILLFSRRKSNHKGEPNKGGRSLLSALIAFGLPLSINQVASQILNLSDRYLILILLGDVEAGLYSVVYRIGDFAVRFVILSLMMSAYTSVTETFEHKGREAAERLVASLTRIYLLLAVPLVVGLWLVQKEVVQVLSAPEYLESASLLGWILLGNFFLGLSQYANFGLHLSKRTMTLATLTLTVALLNVVLNWVLLPKYGYSVAAYTTCFCFGLLAAITPVVSNRFLSWRIQWISLFRILIASAAMGFAIHFPPNFFQSNLFNLLVDGSVGIVVYGISLVVLREVSIGDLRNLR